MSKIIYPVFYNDVDLNTINGLTVLSTDAYRPGHRSTVLAAIARSNKSKLTSAFYTEKFIVVTVEITRDNRGQLEQSLDALNAIIQQTEKPLVLNQSTTRRKYYATLDDVVVDEENEGGSFIKMDLIFALSDRFGYDLASTLLLTITGFTSYNRSDPITLAGSALWQVPVTTITYTAISGGTSKTVTIGNGSNGQAVSITRTWIAGDVLVIDPFNRTVKVNNTEVAFTGAIPEWNKGLGYWYYNDNLTSRTFNGSVTCVARYV